MNPERTIVEAAAKDAFVGLVDACRWPAGSTQRKWYVQQLYLASLAALAAERPLLGAALPKPGPAPFVAPTHAAMSAPREEEE